MVKVTVKRGKNMEGSKSPDYVLFPAMPCREEGRNWLILVINKVISSLLHVIMPYYLSSLNMNCYCKIMVTIIVKRCFHVVKSGDLPLGLDFCTTWFCDLCTLTKHHTHSRALQILYGPLFSHTNTLYQKARPLTADTL